MWGHTEDGARRPRAHGRGRPVPRRAILVGREREGIGRRSAGELLAHVLRRSGERSWVTSSRNDCSEATRNASPSREECRVEALERSDRNHCDPDEEEAAMQGGSEGGRGGRTGQYLGSRNGVGPESLQ